MIKSKVFPYIAIMASVTFGGVSYIATDLCLNYMEPVTLATIRCVVAAVMLTIIWKIKEPKIKVKLKHMPRLIVSGFIGIVLYFICEINGVKFTSPAIASIILASIPILSLIFQRISGREKLNVMKIAGVIISLIGVALVIGFGFTDVNASGKTAGYLFMLGAALCWVIFNYTTYPLYQYYTPLTISAYQMIAGALGTLPLFLLSGEALPQLNVTVGVSIVFLSVFCSAVGMLMYMYAFKSLGILTTTLFINIQPLITVIASMIILKEFLTFNQLIGGILVIAAVYLSTYRRRDTPLVKNENQSI